MGKNEAGKACLTKTERCHPVVIAPTYNNARTLPDLLERLGRLPLPVIVVNDGATDDTSEILEVWTQRASRYCVIAHSRNRGKGAALRSGFAAAADRGFTHAVTIDTDLQHDPEEIPGLLQVASRAPRALVIGRRDRSIHGYPFRSLLGRYMNNLAIRLECGCWPGDSQSGFRIYPLELIREVTCTSNHYEFESEIITGAVRAGYELQETSITSRYFSVGFRVSHFRPLRDTLKHVVMHVRLMKTRAFGQTLSADRVGFICPQMLPPDGHAQ